MRSLQFTRKDPSKGYLNNNLLIPKSNLSVAAVKQALTFVIGEETLVDEETNEIIGSRQKTWELWDETRHHIVVPRAFLTPDGRKSLGIDWAEESHVSFKWPAVSFRDNIEFRNKMQDDAFEAMMEHYQTGGILNLGCGKGKTVLALKLAAWLKVPTLIVVNTTALLEQWREEINKHLGISVDDIGIIQGEQCEWEGRGIAIAMIHTLSNKREQWSMKFRKHWGLVVYDETHHLSAPHFVRSADLFYGWRIGLTATATRTDRLEAIYQYHIGRIFFTDLEQDLVPDTKFHVLDWDIQAKDLPKIRDKSGDVNLSKVRTFVGSQKWRVSLIVDKLIEDMKAGRTALVLSHSVPGVKALYEEYCRRVGGPQADEAGIIIGETEQEDRIPILRHCNPVFGTFQLAREGLDKPSLDTLYITTPFANSNDLQQAWGRIQRAFEGKLHPLIRVFEDTAIGICSRSCRMLRKFLKALKYPIDRVKERLDGRADNDEQEVARGHNGRPGKVRRPLRGTERRAAERAALQAGRRVAVHQPARANGTGLRQNVAPASAQRPQAVQGAVGRPRKLVRHRRRGNGRRDQEAHREGSRAAAARSCTRRRSRAPW